ncbi:MAG: hypothetical protein ACFCVD_10565 [Nodosilinea sp.]
MNDSTKLVVNQFISAGLITASLALVQPIASAQTLKIENQPVYTEASHLVIEESQSDLENQPMGGPYVSTLPDGDVRTWDEISDAIALSLESSLKPGFPTGLYPSTFQPLVEIDFSSYPRQLTILKVSF